MIASSFCPGGRRRVGKLIGTGECEGQYELHENRSLHRIPSGPSLELKVSEIPTDARLPRNSDLLILSLSVNIPLGTERLSGWKL